MLSNPGCLAAAAALIVLAAPPALGQTAVAGGKGAVRVVHAGALAAPADGALVEETVHQGEKMVTRIMRLAPRAKIPEHHHPYFEEAFVVQSGAVSLQLDGTGHQLRAGDVVYIPAGTVIAGENASGQEATVVVTWANNGRPGPLTVPGKPSHH